MKFTCPPLFLPFCCDLCFSRMLHSSVYQCWLLLWSRIWPKNVLFLHKLGCNWNCLPNCLDCLLSMCWRQSVIGLSSAILCPINVHLLRLKLKNNISTYQKMTRSDSVLIFDLRSWPLLQESPHYGGILHYRSYCNFYSSTEHTIRGMGRCLQCECLYKWCSVEIQEVP